MSNTPRTDEQAGALIDAEEVVPADFARELEIELNEQVLLNGKGSEREYSLLGKIERLERENAALRALLIRIRNEKDLLKTRPGAQDQYAGMPPVYRLIDAALTRKEAQP